MDNTLAPVEPLSRFLTGFFFVCLGFSFFANAQAQVTAAVAEIVDFRGEVETLAKGTTTWRPAQAKQFLYQGDVVRTGADGWVAILADDESQIQLNRHTRLVLKEVAPRAGWLRKVSEFGRSVYQLLRDTPTAIGEASVRNNNTNVEIDVETPSVNASIRGTALVLKVSPDNTGLVEVLQGRVLATNVSDPTDVVTVNAGERVVAETGKPLTLQRLRLAPEDAVQWTLFVPPLFEERDIAPLRANRPLFEGLETALGNLQAGEITFARALAERLTQRYPAYAAPWRLLALTSLVLNRRQEALQAAAQGVAAAPESPAALLMLSHARQASFDLEGAREATEKALALDPDNVLALTNIARLQFGSDQIESAWRNLERAYQLAPGDAEVHNLRGFVLLARRDTEGAIEAFRQAIRLNGRLGEPYLGLGLARMRQGKVDEALRAIATAVLLQPRRSLFYSYWGKMLHQVKRFGKALQMLELAKQFDPRDPTPFQVEGLILRDLNRPTEAVRALQKAIALNDGRGVFRSRFLLDQDLAVRNVDLSQVYDQLGLAAWAKNKALASIRQDYTNFSAHVMLAGALAQEEDRAWAQASEALLSRLLQPANVNSFNTYNHSSVITFLPSR